MRDRIQAVARILLAAAHADQHVEASELDKIREILTTLWAEGGKDPVPAKVFADLDTFDAAKADLNELAKPFKNASAKDKRRILELTVSVHDADGELDYAEDTFVGRLGLALGLTVEQFNDLLLEILPDKDEAGDS
jgi:uncharacterized tellurite resistance protein B-like protein